MPKKSHKFSWPNLFLLILTVVLSVALYFGAYYFFRQLAIANNRPPIAAIPQTAAPDTGAAYSHLPGNEDRPVAVTPPPVVVPAASSTPPPVVKPTPPVAPQPAIATDTANLLSAALDLSKLSITGSPVATSSDTNLSFGSFQENFVSSANIDLSRTNLYRDNSAAAMFFPPDYSWTAATPDLINLFQNNLASLKFNDFNGPYADERCLGGNCLTQQGNDLFYNGRQLAWPVELQNADVAAVSIGSLTDSWLVGFTIKDGNNYSGLVFHFDGAGFAPLALPAAVSSSSFGLFGFGGDESDFLVIYGAAPGIAYRVRGTDIRDISRWFSARLLGQGFKPEAIRAKRGSDVAWYVSSSTLGRPRLIKLWQNGTADIVGEADFTGLLFGDTSLDAAAFKLVSSQDDGIVMLADIRNGSADSWRTFTDRGFKNTQAGVYVTQPITHDGAGSAIMINSIAAARLGLDGGSAPLTQFLFSEDGVNWRTIPAAANADFTTDKITSYRLQISWPAFPDRFYSPFLNSVLFDYYARKFKD